MPSACSSHSTNMGYCEKCHGVVPVTRAKRDNSLYLPVSAPTAAPKTPYPRDAKAYYDKREFMGYKGEAERRAPSIARTAGTASHPHMW